MIKAAAEVNNRVIVVVEAGSAVTMEGWLEDVEAVLMAWYPGMEGGAALAELIFGEANPSGKLPVVFPKSLDQLPKFDNKSKEVVFGKRHGYRWFDEKGLAPLFPFGFGLSYTTFQFTNLKLSASSVGASGKLTASVDVANTGAVAGEEVVQLYVAAKGSAVERPPKDLKAFSRVALAPGEKKTVTLEVPVADLAYFCDQGMQWVVEQIEYEALVGPSSRESDLLRAGFAVKG
jgi:beta-glucosidase